MGDHSPSTWIHRLPWVAALCVLSAVAGLALNPSWGVLLKPHLPWLLQPTFHDWWVVKQGIEAHVAGIDPLLAPHLPYNYPRLLLFLGSTFHWQAVPPNAAGLGLATLVLGSLAFFLGKGSAAQIVLGSCALLAPPVWMLIERGNIDSLVLALVLWGLWGITRREQKACQWLGVTVLLLASLLKFYPVVILIGGLFAWSGILRRCLLGALVIFGIALAINPEEPGLILRKTGRGLEASYGWSVAGSRPFVLHAADPAHKPAIMRSSFFACLSMLAAGALLGWKARQRTANILTAEPWRRAGFWAGALVYIGTFALGANWAYRLSFLLLCLPFIIATLNEPDCRRWALVTLSLIAFTLFAPFQLGEVAFYFVHACEWTLAGLLTIGAGAVLLGSPQSSAPSTMH